MLLTLMHRLLNFAAFYLCWIACVAGAARGHVWLGPALVAATLALHLALAAAPGAEARLVAAAGLLGFILETLSASAGLYAFTHASGSFAWLCPPWMAALWMIFATTLNGSLAWLADRHTLAAVLGAVAGPASYLAGARLDAITLHPNATISVAGIAIVWAMALPALLWLRRFVR